MSNKKQTAVEWLVEQMIYQMDIRIENTTIGCELFEQAKEMEKEQIMKAFNAGTDEEAGNTNYISEENYYNETYGVDISHALHNGLLNGFINGRDISDGVGRKPFQTSININEKSEVDMLLNRFANDLYWHLRPSKLMTTNDLAQFIIDWMNVKLS